MNHHPKISPKSTIEKVHDWVCIIVIAGFSVYTVFSLFQIPETIPTHYNAEGKADGWGSK